METNDELDPKPKEEKSRYERQKKCKK